MIEPNGRLTEADALALSYWSAGVFNLCALGKRSDVVSVVAHGFRHREDLCRAAGILWSYWFLVEARGGTGNRITVDVAHPTGDVEIIETLRTLVLAVNSEDFRGAEMLMEQTPEPVLIEVLTTLARQLTRTMKGEA